MRHLSGLIVVLVVALLTFGAGFFWLLNRLTPETIALNQETARIRAETAKIQASQRLIEQQIAAQITLTQLRNEQVIKDSGLYFGSCAVAYSFRELWLVWLFLSIVSVAVNQRFRFEAQVKFAARGIETMVSRKHAETLIREVLKVDELEVSQRMISADADASRDRFTDTVGAIRAIKGLIPKDVTAIESAQQPQPGPGNAPFAKIPTFRDMATYLDQGDDLIFGYSAIGEARTGTWVDLFSSAIGGQSGQGKTATLRSIISQSLITQQVATFWVIDWHYPHPKSLLASLGALKDHPAIRWVENPFDIPKLLQEVEDTIDRRLRLEEASEPVKVLVCDEVLILCDRIPQMSHVIKRIGTESRKCGVYGLFSSQSWKADSVGGSEVRDCLTSRIAHKMQPKQANMLLQDAEQAKLVRDLTTGHVLFVPTNGDPEILQVPYCDPEDMNFVVNRLRRERIAPDVSRNAQAVIETTNDVELNESQAERVKNEMDAQRISLNTLSKKMGIAKSTLSNFLNEKGNLSDDQLVKIQTFLQRS